MRIVIIRGEGRPTPLTNERLCELLAGMLPDASDIEVVAEAQPESTLNGLTSLVSEHNLTSEDVFVLDTRLPQSVLRDYLAERGIFRHLSRPHLVKILTDAGGLFWRLGRPHSAIIWTEDYP